MTIKVTTLATVAVISTFVSITSALADIVSTSSTAEIHRPIEVTAGDGLDFGSFVANPSVTGHVTIEPENNRSECSVAFCGGAFSPSSFDISGQPGQMVLVSHVGDSLNSITFSMTDSTYTVTFGLILHTPNITRDAAGEGSFNIGARARIPGNTPEGSYSGSYNVQVDYQ